VLDRNSPQKTSLATFNHKENINNNNNNNNNNNTQDNEDSTVIMTTSLRD